MKRPYAAFTGSGGRPTDIVVDPNMYNVFTLTQQGIHVVLFYLDFGFEKFDLKLTC